VFRNNNKIKAKMVKMVKNKYNKKKIEIKVTNKFIRKLIKAILNNK